MNELKIFEYGNAEIEVITLNGEIYFNPYHVGAILSMAEATVRRHMQKLNEKQAVLLTNSNVHSMNIRKLHNTGEKFLTESGVYKLVFKSRKNEAEKFTDWLAEEVLPSIRKTGSYSLAIKSRDVIFGEHMRMAKTLSETTEIELFDSVESAIEATEQETGSNLNHFKKLIDKHSPNGWKKIFLERSDCEIS